jgi:hypothetical protein
MKNKLTTYTQPPGQHDYDAIQSVIDGVDEVARCCENRWGVGRLELLVSNDLREKFRRQLKRFNDAITEHDVARVRITGAAMQRAWQALDQAATEAKAPLLAPEYWEAQLTDGRLVAICRANVDAHAVVIEGRAIDVWTTQELIRVIENFPEVALAKATFPGATVISAKSKRALDMSEGEQDLYYPDQFDDAEAE